MNHVEKIYKLLLLFNLFRTFFDCPSIDYSSVKHWHVFDERNEIRPEFISISQSMFLKKSSFISFADI